jgi:hypothetical protein
VGVGIDILEKVCVNLVLDFGNIILASTVSYTSSWWPSICNMYRAIDGTDINKGKSKALGVY